MPCYEPRDMREQTAIPHKLLYGFNSEMYWKVSQRGDEIIEDEKKIDEDDDEEDEEEAKGKDKAKEKVKIAGFQTVAKKIEKKYKPNRNFIQVLNREADEVKTYPIKEGSTLYDGISHDLCTQLMRIDDDNTLLCFCTDDRAIYHFHHLEKD